MKKAIQKLCIIFLFVLTVAFSAFFLCSCNDTPPAPTPGSGTEQGGTTDGGNTDGGNEDEKPDPDDGIVDDEETPIDGAIDGSKPVVGPKN